MALFFQKEADVIKAQSPDGLQNKVKLNTYFDENAGYSWCGNILSIEDCLERSQIDNNFSIYLAQIGWYESFRTDIKTTILKLPCEGLNIDALFPSSISARIWVRNL